MREARCTSSIKFLQLIFRTERLLCFIAGSEFFLQGVLLSWTKKFKVRGVQDTDVVKCLTKAMKKHKVRNWPPRRELSQSRPFLLTGGGSHRAGPGRRIREGIHLREGLTVVLTRPIWINPLVSLFPLGGTALGRTALGPPQLPQPPQGILFGCHVVCNASTPTFPL